MMANVTTSVLSLADYVRVLSAGGGVTVSADRFDVADVVKLAQAAALGGARLRLTNAGRFSDVNDLTRIATVGRGRVEFEGL